ncbi:hypothetical protein BJ944DRAFT_177102 [Cunninghamella echinulata]|nr:hypothetical protein BJ944DRAFT_177102 [Cunninghamella echinulata]
MAPKVSHFVEIPNTKREGETSIYRSSRHEQSLLSTYDNSISSFYDVFQNTLREGKDLPCLGTRHIINPLTQERSTEYEFITYGQVSQRADALGSGIRSIMEEHLGISSTELLPLGIWAINRLEWTLSDIACVNYGYYSVSLYDTLGEDTVRYVINHSELQVVICSGNHIGHLLEIAHQCPILKIIISMDPLTSENNGQALKAWAKEKNIHLVEMEEVQNIGAKSIRPHIKPNPSDLGIVLYTSGTTGNPKGAMISHSNLLACLSHARTVQDYRFGEDVNLSYLPLPHIFGRVMDWAMLSSGGRIGYFSGTPELLLDDLQALKPTIFASVPRVLNRIYGKLLQATVNAPGTKGAIARMAVNAKLQRLKQNNDWTHPFWDRLIFNKVKQALGGRVKLIVTGSAPISGEVMEFLKIAFSTEFIEVYGSTENTGCASCHQPGEYRVGHVGAPCLTTELKLVDVPEMNYLTTDRQPRGEIVTRGTTTFMGYFKEEEKTNECLIDGWYYTGDIGMINQEGCLVIIDRKKNIFKLAQGEYIAPEKIENVFTNDPLVMQAFVYGDSLQSSLVAVIVPDPEELVVYAKQQNITGATLEELCRNPVLTKKFFTHLTKVAKAGKLHGFEIPKAIYLEPNPFTVENNILTPTMKLKRHDAKLIYQQQINTMYEQIANSPQSKL